MFLRERQIDGGHDQCTSEFSFEKRLLCRLIRASFRNIALRVSAVTEGPRAFNHDVISVC